MRPAHLHQDRFNAPPPVRLLAVAFLFELCGLVSGLGDGFWALRLPKLPGVNVYWAFLHGMILVGARPPFPDRALSSMPPLRQSPEVYTPVHADTM